MTKKFTTSQGNILLNHQDSTLRPTVIATASTGWASIIASALNRSDATLKMVKGA